MINEKETLVEQYNYTLPNSRIARYPLEKRDGSRLLVYRKGNISSAQFSDLHKVIDPESVLVFNNTRVVQARLIFHKKTIISLYRIQKQSPETKKTKKQY